MLSVTGQRFLTYHMPLPIKLQYKPQQNRGMSLERGKHIGYFNAHKTWVACEMESPSNCHLYPFCLARLRKRP